MSAGNPNREAPARRWRRVSGILLLDKPPGISSNQALQVVRRALQAAKGGHTGNLDVAATGLLPLCFGEATKVCSLLLDSTKRYLAEVQLGRTTTTGDLEGEVTSTATALPTERAVIEAALTHFRGAQLQIPPMFSALKHQGQPLYKLARRGIEIERAPREVTISKLTLLDLAGDRLHLDITCSKGTYIRSLAIDLGAHLGCGATLAHLRRVQVGHFTVTQAHPLDVFSAAYSPATLDELLLPLDAALTDYAMLELAVAAAHGFVRGQALEATTRLRGAVRVYHQQRFLGIGMVDDLGRLLPKRVMQPD